MKAIVEKPPKPQIRCDICGNSYENIISHMRLKHNVDVSQKTGASTPTPLATSPPRIAAVTTQQPQQSTDELIDKMMAREAQLAFIDRLRSHSQPQQQQPSMLETLKLMSELQKQTPNSSISEIVKAIRDLREFSGELIPQPDGEDAQLLEIAKMYMQGQQERQHPPQQQIMPQQTQGVQQVNISTMVQLAKAELPKLSDEQFQIATSYIDDLLDAEAERRGLVLPGKDEDAAVPNALESKITAPASQDGGKHAV